MATELYHYMDYAVTIREVDYRDYEVTIFEVLPKEDHSGHRYIQRHTFSSGMKTAARVRANMWIDAEVELKHLRVLAELPL